MTALADVKINPVKYGQLLAKTLPAVIETEEENERMLAEVKKLLKKGGNLSPEEEKLLDLLSTLIEDFEETAYPIPPAPPHAVIQMLMTDRNPKQRDLLPILGTRRVTSEIVGGKRLPTQEQAQGLGEFFHLSPELFLSSQA